MKQKIYQVDAFAESVFTGNPAAVCPLNEWLSDEVMQKIGMENNLAETAFYVKRDDYYELRWFTPMVEVDLCGHATLAAAFVLFNHEGHDSDVIQFHSPRSGPLTVTRNGELLTLNFPTDKVEEVSISDLMQSCLNVQPIAAFKGLTDFLLIFENEQQIRQAIPDLVKIEALGGRGTIISAPGESVDFVSRFFAPQCGVPEDPVTGSAHTTLTPYWSKTLDKTKMNAIQLSNRTGQLQCTYLNDRVEISGKGKLYLIGEIALG
ncbi:MAG: PhzF family phenazine biosynthesis protein [Cytophagales bacterium]|nr:PhzF family phenazine biosynthesis protein [Cytophagales bacterium]